MQVRKYSYFVNIATSSQVQFDLLESDFWTTYLYLVRHDKEPIRSSLLGFLAQSDKADLSIFDTDPAYL